MTSQETTKFDRVRSQSIAILDLQASQLIEDLNPSATTAINGGTGAFVRSKKPIPLGGIDTIAAKIPPQVISAYRCPDGTIVTYCSDGSGPPPVELCPGSQAI